MKSERLVIWKDINIFPDGKDEPLMHEADGEDEDEMMPLPMNINRISVTPMGAVSISEEHHPFRDVQFSICHTNFDITADILSKVNKEPGVEYLRVISRYRFVIGIGALFTKRDIQANIQDLMGIREEENPFLESIREELDAKYGEESWLGYVFPNGVVVDAKVSTDEDLEATMAKYTELQKLSNGVIIP